MIKCIFNLASFVVYSVLVLSAAAYGFSKGSKRGHEAIKHVWLNEGLKRGFQKGKFDGFSKGYEKGYNDCRMGSKK